MPWSVSSFALSYHCHDKCTICIIPSINAMIIFIICLILALSAMMNLSFASFGIILCIISSLPWRSHHLHHLIITSASIHFHFLIVKNMEQEFLVTSSLCLSSSHFGSAPCWKIPFSFQGAIRLFHNHKSPNSISFSNYVGMFGESNWPFRKESLSCVLQRLHVEIYELNEFDELVLVNV